MSRLDPTAATSCHNILSTSKVTRLSAHGGETLTRKDTTKRVFVQRVTIPPPARPLIATITSDDFDFDRIKPLLRLSIADEPDNALWKRVDDAVIESTPSPRLTTSSFQ
ncbi:hypothetical protein BN1723_004352 [Verticillium longisporum]|uniref:Uncharacterized protein n=1 Tax=Verticillium longisporum TaxID=100787 RepID=A0A0G4MUV3_VERLO|nr:hypothetical protein BN1723_004352 [Verticillium longisporum]